MIWPEIEDNDFMADDKVYLIRKPSEKVQTLGRMMYQGKEVAKTLELPWLDNKNRVSCIPTGTYDVVRRWSKAHGDHFHITNVPGRDKILIHKGNYHTDILGCILTGKSHAYINKDKYLDVRYSGDTMKMLLELLPQTFKLTIVNE